MRTYLYCEAGFVEKPQWLPNCWVNVVCPDNDDFEFLTKTLNVPESFLNDIADTDERPRTDTEGNWLLTILRIPMQNGQNESLPFGTVPIGIITNNEIIVSVCYHNTDLLPDFIEHTRRKGIEVRNKLDLILRLIYSSAVWFLKYLKQINLDISAAEKELERSIRDLTQYLPLLRSVSVVPVGLSKYRDGLYPLEPFTKEEAKEVIRTIEKWQKKVYAEYGIHFIHAGDEWYLLAEEEVPEEERYDGYLQLENGVGMLRLLFNEFEEGYAKLESGEHQEEISLATAKLAYPYLERMAKKMEEKYEGLKVHTYCIRNDFFGERITVSGLITGQDLMKQLKDQPLGSRLLIPCNMLKMDEDIFLDDFTLKEVSDTLQVPIDIVKSSGQDLIDAILGVAGPNPTDIDENQMKDRRITTA